MALSNKSPLGFDISNMVAHLKEQRGISTSSFGDEIDAEVVAMEFDAWQEGLNQEYADQVQLESMMGE